jgi:uroporphyrin-III C-methyltransferase
MSSSEPLDPARDPAPTAPTAPPVPPAPRLAPDPAAGTSASAVPRWLLPVLALLILAVASALGLAWNTQQRLKVAEQEMARRQQDTGSQAVEARTLARQADASARDAAAKVALLDARVAENAIQRSQLEELLQSLSRSRDENVLADVDAALRVAMQQSAITGSVEPLMSALRQTDERLARYQQPRLERVRRAALQDLDRVRAAGGVDLTTLTLRIDEVVRVVDELPLVSAADRRVPRRVPPAATPAASAASAPTAAAVAASAAASAAASSSGSIREALGGIASLIWNEARALIRVTRIDAPEAALLAPEQAFFVRENLKLRLLNARLAILSRQFDTAQSDLRAAQGTLERYFDQDSRRVAQAVESTRQIAAQARQVNVPRPDATLAAVAAAAAGR